MITKSIFSKPSLPIAKKDENRGISYQSERSLGQDKNKEKRFLKEQPKIQINTPNQIVSNTKIEQTSEEKGLEQAIRNHADKVEKNRQAVEDMVKNSNRVLLKISSVFPFELFPTSIIAEDTRITIINRQLFSSQVHSVDVKNISNIFLDTSILFAELTIVSNTFAENEIVIDRLWKKEAILMRRIIEGLRMFISKDIDTTGYKVGELVNKLKELSTTKTAL
jgi:hypothetical protein